jgi:hypothetical protein
MAVTVMDLDEITQPEKKIGGKTNVLKSMPNSSFEQKRKVSKDLSKIFLLI